MKIIFEKSTWGRDPKGAQPDPHSFDLCHRSESPQEYAERRRKNEPHPPPGWYEDGCLSGVTYGIPYKEGGRWEFSLCASPDELRTWVREYVKKNPAEALEMIAEVLPGVAVALKENS